MITGSVTKNGLGIEFTANGKYLRLLNNTIHTLADIETVDIPEMNSNFLLALAYDLRKAYEGKRGNSVLFSTGEDEYSLFSNRVLWPTYLVQVSMLKFLAQTSSNPKYEPLITTLERCAVDALLAADPMTAQFVRQWLNQPPIHAQYLTQYADDCSIDYAQGEGATQAQRIATLPDYLDRLNPNSIAYTLFSQDLQATAAEFDCSVFDLVRKDNLGVSHDIEW